MKSFVVAAQQAEAEEEVLEFSILGEEFACQVPTTGQISLVLAASGAESNVIRTVYRFLKKIMLDDGYDRLIALVEDGKLPFDTVFLGEGDGDGIVAWIIEEAAARPTQEPSGSSATQKPTGTKSTGRSPGKGSTRSTSASANS